MARKTATQKRLFGQIVRGNFNFVVLNAGDLTYRGKERFDTYAGEQGNVGESGRMAAWLRSLDGGLIVLGAVRDDGARRLTADARLAMKEVLGAQLVETLAKGESYAVAGVVGAAAPLAEEKKPVGTAVAVARGGVTCPAALVSADEKTYYSYAAQMSYAAYQAANP